MKVEDIQIGDWVQNPLGAPYQVLAIHFYKINGDGDGYYGIHLKNKGAEARLEIYDLHPVPLTPEILEKNFREYLPGIKLMYQLKGPYFAMNEEGNQWVFGLVKEDGEKSCRYPLVKITYVHELQHALRLCGIEKEIVL